MTELAALPRHWLTFLDQRLTRLETACREAAVPFYDDAGVDDHLKRVLLASDFAYDTFLNDPTLLGPDLVRLMVDPRHADARASGFAALSAESMVAELRRFRKREALRLIWRDVNNVDTVDTTLTGASVLAEVCLEVALAHTERTMTQRYGVVHASDGSAQRLIIMALGKLGGSELNFSSDIDLVLGFPEAGCSDGERSLEAEAYFARQGQQLVALLAERNADGYVFRVDLRLRPFGNAGRLAQSFSAMEHYYQREGRDWERYAWIKARPVAGDRIAGKRFVELMRPFVFRRYFDYTAFSGLREMKALIDAEVARKDLADHLKLGPGGIREIEFIVQLIQLIRGGREPELRVQGLLPALTVCEQRGLIPTARAKRLAHAYRFMRRLENRLQMFADQQTHELPQDNDTCQRIALALGYSSWSILDAELTKQRAFVSEEFAALMAPAVKARDSQASTLWPAWWQQVKHQGVNVTLLAEMGFAPAEEPTAAFEELLNSSIIRGLSPITQERLDRLLPAVLAAAANSQVPATCLARLIRLLHTLAKRPVYLALLDEQPAALKHLTHIFSQSAFLADRVTTHPLLLDELFDTRMAAQLPDRAAVESEINRRLAMLSHEGLKEVDPDVEIEILQEEKLSAQFRIGLALVNGQLNAVAAARALTDVAEAVLASVLRIAERDIVLTHGRIIGQSDENSGLLIIGYGSLGGGELGFNSDLDVVFIYDGALTQHETIGPRVLDGARYYLRLAQRVVHLLTMPTRSGRLYEIDVRLRPDGGKGLLVTSLEGFMSYQAQRAWTWEHQALVRARPVAGGVALARRFAVAREELLCTPRQREEIYTQISQMRKKWRAERDRSDMHYLDLKQGPGALVDIEFLLQGLVLLYAQRYRALLASSNSAELIEIISKVSLLTVEQTHVLAVAHSILLQRALKCTLDSRSRLVLRDQVIDAHVAAVLGLSDRLGFNFTTN